MALSSSTDFEPDVSEYIEEAFERCGLEIRTGYDLKSAKRSLNLLFAEWANRGLNRWTIEQSTLSITSGTNSYSLGADTIDILSAVIRTGTGTNQNDQQITRVSRDTYLNIPSKNSTGKPSQWYVDRQIAPTVKLWPTPDDSYTLVYDRLTRMNDADTYINTLEVPFRFYPCLTAGLAYYLSMKRNPQLMGALKTIYEEELQRALDEDRDRASLRISPSYETYRS